MLRFGLKPSQLLTPYGTPSFATVYPALKRWAKLFRAYGGLLSFELADGIDIFEFMNRLKIVVLSSNLGDNRTLAIPVAGKSVIEPKPLASFRFSNNAAR